MKQFWTKDEMDKLAEMAAQGKTNVQIAAALGRSVGSVAHKRARLFRDAEQADKLSAVTYCDDPHRPEEITAEDDLMKEVSDVIDRLNTLSDALAGTSEFMEELREGQKIITEDQIDQQRQLNEIVKSMDAHDRTARALEDEVAELKKRTDLIAENVSQINIYLNLGPLYRLFHSFRKFREVRNRG